MSLESSERAELAAWCERIADRDFATIQDALRTEEAARCLPEHRSAYETRMRNLRRIAVLLRGESPTTLPQKERGLLQCPFCGVFPPPARTWSYEGSSRYDMRQTEPLVICETPDCPASHTGVEVHLWNRRSLLRGEQQKEIPADTLRINALDEACARNEAVTLQLGNRDNVRLLDHYAPSYPKKPHKVSGYEQWHGNSVRDVIDDWLAERAERGYASPSGSTTTEV